MCSDYRIGSILAFCVLLTGCAGPSGVDKCDEALISDRHREKESIELRFLFYSETVFPQELRDFVSELIKDNWKYMEGFDNNYSLELPSALPEPNPSGPGYTCTSIPYEHTDINGNFGCSTHPWLYKELVDMAHHGIESGHLLLNSTTNSGDVYVDFIP